MERTLRITATLSPDHELGGYVAQAVGVGGVVSQGETVEDATANLGQALELYFADEAPGDLPWNNQVWMTSVNVRLST